MNQPDINIATAMADNITEATGGDPARIAQIMGLMVAYFCHPDASKPTIDGKEFGAELCRELNNAGK